MYDCAVLETVALGIRLVGMVLLVLVVVHVSDGGCGVEVNIFNPLNYKIKELVSN